MVFESFLPSLTEGVSPHVEFIRTTDAVPVDGQVSRAGALATASESKPECLSELSMQLLRGSEMIYAYAYLRKYVSLSMKEEAGKEGAKKWSKPELIITQNGEELQDRGFARHLRYPVTGEAIHNFLVDETNAELLKDKKDIVRVLDDKGFDVDAMTATVDELRGINGEIIEFDDEWQTQDLVYAIFANHDSKRITIVFRGSVSNSNDWNANFKIRYSEKLPKPEQLADIPVEGEDDIRIHRGFHGYIHQETPEGTIKLNDIVGHIKNLYKKDKYQDYQLYVTGHSLGAALAAYLSYTLSGRNDIMDIIPGPVTAITFAAPQMANPNCNNAFEALERKGNLRHIRFSNQGDIVPVAPFGFGYTQTGLHVFMKAYDAADVGHRNLKRSTFQFRIFPWVMTRAHALAEHQKRLEFEDNQEMLCSKTVEEFYQEYYPEAAAAKPNEADQRKGIEQSI